MEFRSLLVYCLIQCITIIGAGAASTSCQSSAYGRRSCNLPSPPGRVRLVGDRLFVGAKDVLLSFTFDLQSSEAVNLSPTNGTIQGCVREQLNPSAECRNFIRVIEPIPPSAVNESRQVDRILVCGTNAYFPKCRLHARTNISDSYFMTPQDREDRGFSPHSERSVVGVLTTYGQFYSGTYYRPYSPQRTIGMAPRPLQRDGTFRIETPSADPLWLNRPEFVSAYEIGDHVYFFVREPAYEVNLGRDVVYSRAIRMCKSDQDGFQRHEGSGETNTFLTFQKARIRCTFTGESGSIPYDYDELQATFLLNATEPILYGVFSAPANGPEGAAICKFSFSQSITPGSLTQVFEAGTYYVPDNVERTSWRNDNPGPFSCPGAGDPQRTPEQARQNQLVLNPATAMNPQPIHSISGDEITSIAVDVIEYRGVQQEVLYYSLRSGEIRQLVTNGSVQREHIINKAGGAVSNVVVYKNIDEIRYLSATTDARIMSFALGNCSQYNGCFECLDSKDPYCVWDSRNRSCLKITAASRFSTPQLQQSSLSSENDVIATCGNRPSVGTQPTPTAKPSTCQVGYAATRAPQQTNLPTGSASPSSNQYSDSSPSTSDADTDCNSSSTPTSDPVPTQVVSAGVDQPTSRPQISIPILVGASVGGFAVGIPFGLVICCVFYVLFVTKRNNNKHQRRSVAVSDGPGPAIVTPINNFTGSQKKEQMLQLQDRYVGINPSAQTPSALKNVNQYNEQEEDDDDVLTELPNTNRRQVPGYGIPRGRTPSTRWLRASESSDISESPGIISPLQSPTATDC